MKQAQAWQWRFFSFWIAQAASLFGSSIAQFALIWWLTTTTNSATVLATAALIGTLPGILISPFAGVLVDRWNRRTILIVADGINALAAGVLMLLFWQSAIEVWHIYIAMAVRATAGAFQFPAVQSSTALMVPEEQLARVAGLNQLLQGIMLIAGPPLGALLVSLWPLAAVLGIDVVTACIAVLLLTVISIPQPQRATPQGRQPGMLDEMVAGLRYIWRWPGLLAVLLIATVINLVLTPAFTLVPILVTQHFGGDALLLASMNAAQGIGLLLGGVLLSIWGGFKQRMRTALLGLIGLGIGTLLLGLAPADMASIALVGMLVVGIMGPLVNGPFFAVIQTIVAPEMQGRVFTVAGSISMGVAPLGLAFAGPLADALGVRSWYLIGGVICFIMSAIVIGNPAIMNLEKRDVAYA
jgi:MFS transporter, DHA3 family, macrolide efflux protein